DYALQDNGGAVACDLTTRCFQVPFTIPGLLVSPNRAITDSDPSESWWFGLSAGQLGVTTNTSIYPTQVTVEYPFDSNSSPDEAPRSMILWGMIEGEENERRFNILTRATAPSLEHKLPSPSKGSFYSRYHFAHLVSFEFNIASRLSHQTFNVLADVKTSGIHFNVFVLEIRSNWGGRRTQVRRLRVHGKAVPVKS
ncbi:hypothetical protein BDY19DRAFT_888739, partial [Irpex rosettiformis]